MNALYVLPGVKPKSQTHTGETTSLPLPTQEENCYEVPWPLTNHLAGRALPSFVPAQIIGGVAAKANTSSGDCVHKSNLLVVKDEHKATPDKCVRART